MGAPGRARPVLWLALRFIALAPPCLVAWWLALPYYGRLTGESARLVLNLLGYGFDGVVIETAGWLRTQTTLAFTGNGGGTRPENVAELATNVAPFTALVLATPRLTWRRRLTALGLGFALLFLSHVGLIVAPGMAPDFVRNHPELYHAFGVFSLVLPIILWFAFTYGSPFWSRIFGEDSADETEGE